MGTIDESRALLTRRRPEPRVVSLLEPGRNCCSVARAERAGVIIDAQAYFQAFAEAAERAERSIIVLAWDFDSRLLLGRDASSRYQRTLGDFLNALARRRKRLRIRILDWDFPLIFGVAREVSPLYGLGWRPHRRISFRYDGTHPLAGSHHQKIVVIDDKVAFSGGLDLTCRRWDTPEHLPADPRRTESGKPYPPFHDVMMAVDGEVARQLGAIAYKRWHAATGERIEPVETASDPWPPSVRPAFERVTVGIACTAPGGEDAREVRDVEQLYVDMIAGARHTIYIENQYFTSSRIGAALAARLAERDGPEIIVVSRLLSHGWLEELTMQTLRIRLVRELRAADRDQRFRIYYPHVEGLAEGTCLDVHSKVMIVDDDWLRVGSANVSNRSMGLDTECDLVIEAGGSPQTAQQIRHVRNALIAEHLGVSVEAFAAKAAASASLSRAIESLQTSGRALLPLPESSRFPEEVIDAVAIADPERPVALDSLMKELAPAEEPRGGSLWVKAALIFAPLLAFMLLWRYTPLSQYASAEAVSAYAEAFASRWWAPLAIVAAYTPASVVMFPRPLITLASVVAFGAVLGAVYALGGILVAAMAGYLAGRMLSRDTVRRIAGPRANKVSNALRQRGLLAMVLVRLAPVAPFVVVSLVAGAIRIRIWHFLLGTAIGMGPGLLAATIFGQQVQTGLADPSQINYGLLAGVAVVLLLGAAAVHRWMSRQTNGGQNGRNASPRNL